MIAAQMEHARLQANSIMSRRIEVEGQKGAEPLVEAVKTIQDFMSTLAPVMAEVRKTDEELQTEGVLVKVRVASQKQASGIGVARETDGERQLNLLVARL